MEDAGVAGGWGGKNLKKKKTRGDKLQDARRKKKKKKSGQKNQIGPIAAEKKKNGEEFG